MIRQRVTRVAVTMLFATAACLPIVCGQSGMEVQRPRLLSATAASLANLEGIDTEAEARALPARYEMPKLCTDDGRECRPIRADADRID